MRSILLLTLILLAVGAAAAVVEPTRKSEPSQPSFALKWVRTADGWERPSTWRPSPRIKPELHPSVVAGFLLLSSLACLFAGPPSRS